jgi:hypothetical protein
VTRRRINTNFSLAMAGSSAKLRHDNIPSDGQSDGKVSGSQCWGALAAMSVAERKRFCFQGEPGAPSRKSGR